MKDNKNLSYLDRVHKDGQTWAWIIFGLVILFPTLLCLIFAVIPDFGALLKGLLATIPVYWTVGIIEIFTYVPMLGAGGSYLSFITQLYQGDKTVKIRDKTNDC